MEILIFFAHGVLVRFDSKFLLPTSFPHLFAMSIMINQVIEKLNPTPLRFGPCCDGVSTVGGGVRKAGFKGGGGVRHSFSGF